jgi:drug/metabolite transporter (DMT)-like permease
MGRPSGWVFWLACAFTLATALVGFGFAMRGPDTGWLLRGIGLLFIAALMGLALAYYALRSLRQLPPSEGEPNTEDSP